MNFPCVTFLKKNPRLTVFFLILYTRPQVVDKSMLDKAHHLMQLFSLRRLKSEVEVSLPPKHELKISVPLSEFQVHFYRGLLMKDVGLLQAAAAQNEASSSAAATAGGDGAGEYAQGKSQQGSKLGHDCQCNFVTT